MEALLYSEISLQLVAVAAVETLEFLVQQVVQVVVQHLVALLVLQVQVQPLQAGQVLEMQALLVEQVVVAVQAA
jgi:hypothetical protein